MDVNVLDHPGAICRVVTPAGQLDMETAPELHATLAQLIGAGQRRIVVDLSKLTFCDSIGLSTLVVAHRSCAEGGGFLRLARPSPFMLNLLTVVGVRDAVGVYDSVDAACADPAARGGTAG
jgi:anti-sigma B factor antagonist